MGLDGRQLPLETEHACGYERLLGEETGSVDQKPGGEVIGAVENHVIGVDEGKNVLSVDELVIGLDGDLWINGGQGAFSRLHLRLSDRRGRMEDLPLQIGQVGDGDAT